MTEKFKQYFLLQITTKLLQISSALLVTNYDSVLTNHGSFFITNYDKVLANCDRRGCSSSRLKVKILDFGLDQGVPGKAPIFKPPRSRLGFREETQNYAKRNRIRIFFLTCFAYRITSVIINQRFLQIVELATTSLQPQHVQRLMRL